MGLLAEHSAITKFATLLRVRIAPKLRELGFRGSGRWFNLREESSIGQLRFQKSRFSDRTHVDFTVDLAIPDADWEIRIGRVMPDGEDRW